MTIAEWIRRGIEASGKDANEICESTGISTRRLQLLLDESREFRVSEFLSLCRALRLNPYDAEDLA